jgi:hypothetical protein
MKVELQKSHCIITREEGDPKIYNESLLLYKVKQELIKQGYDVIKKRMWKDGHLYGDETLQYIRMRNYKDEKNFFQIYDNFYAVRAMTKEYNDGELDLWVDRGGE